MTAKRVLLVALISPLLALTAFAAEAPSNLRCQWRVNPLDVRNPCPEFYWECDSQTAYQLFVDRLADAMRAPSALVWDSGKVASQLPIVRYAGPPLENGIEYCWSVRVWDGDGQFLAPPPLQHFRLNVQPMQRHLPTVRTFINFAGRPDFARDWLDLCFRKEAKQGREEIVTLVYGLVSTMVLPHPSTGKPLSGKAKELADFCVARGLTEEGILEDMFCHFAEDTRVRLHVGAEQTSKPIEDRVCPGWDPRNDRNGDGKVDDAEFAQLANPKARARQPRQARIPIYYWGPPQDDFVMNVGHPAYQEFMATVHAPRIAEGYDGIYFDTVPTDVPAAGRSNPVLEYPRQGKAHDQWLRDLQVLFAKMKLRLPDRIITGNGWNADPMVIDGRQSEGWQSLDRQADRWQAAIDTAVELDRQGKIQLIQYNPIFHPELSDFGPKLPVDHDRDKIFGLATYLLAHGDFTYFGFGRHPYANVTKLYFDAIRFDLGEPEGPYYLYDEVESGRTAGSKNLLENGDFETGDAQSNPGGWVILEPVELDTEVKHSGASSVKITSTSSLVNNINRQHVRLKPHTSYTLIAWAKVNQVTGRPGAQVYPYEFEGARGGGMLTWQGTHEWREQRTVFKTAADVEGRINFRMYGATGTAWFDGLRLVEGVAVRYRVFARQYARGLALVKPYLGGSFGDDTGTTHKLPGTFRSLRVDGTLAEPVDQVTLRNAEAVILVK